MSTALPFAAIGEELRTAAAAPAFAPVRERIAALDIGEDALHDVVARVSHGRDRQREFLALRARVLQAGPFDASASFERYALLRSALAAVSRIPALALPEDVKRLTLEEFQWIARPPERQLGWLTAGEYVFSALCKLVTLRRFPAGQMHWEVSGLPRSVLWRVRPRDVGRLARGLLSLGGFRPALVPHLAWRRRQIVLSEREHYRSLALMAQALELQPQIRGFVAEAWFYSPDTAAASPHLAWAPRLFEAWGGVVVVTGRAGNESGVFESGRTRQQLAEQGRFRPTLGLAIWPRAAMLRWAHAEAGRS